MCPQHVCVGELVRVSEGEVDVRLCGKMEDCVNPVFSQNALNSCGTGDVAVLEGEIREVVEGSCVVQRRAVVEFVERDYIVVGVRQG